MIKRRKTLLLCSYGLRPDQITLETLTRLKSCGAVYSNCLDRTVTEKFKPYCKKLRFLSGSSWESLGKKVFAAFANCDKIAFLTYGNPFFLNQPACALAEEAARRGIAFEVMEGISSFDGIINQLRLGQFSQEGLRLVNLGDGFGAGTRKPAPSMDTLFFSLWALEAGKPGGKKALFRALASAYAPEHPVLIMDHPNAVKSDIRGLPEALKKAPLTATLFIPAAPGPNVGRRV